MHTPRFTKGHGTGNDFVLISDYDGALELHSDFVRAVCDRRFGIGADGLIRVVRTERASQAPDIDVVASPGGPEWFMDYWNADGSLSEMCGNGVRVFARYLVDHRLVQPGRLHVATRGGVRVLDVPVSGDIAVDMGAPVWQDHPGHTSVSLGGTAYEAVGLGMPNPHAVTLIADLDSLPAHLVEPDFDPQDFPEGVNVEFVQVVSHAPPHIRMRVHERGSGETLSCGTGACAAAVVAARDFFDDTDQPIRVDVPGGTLTVQRTAAGGVRLIGPAVVVADGTFSHAWLEQHL